MPTLKRCAGCGSAGYMLKLDETGYCPKCAIGKRGIAEEAALEAQVEAWMHNLEATLERLGRFHTFLLERPDGPADEPEPATGWRRLPLWRRERPEPVVYDDEG